MDTAKWQSIKGLMSELLDLPESERAAALEREPDAEIRNEVELLLAAHDSSDRFIERPFLIEHGIAPDETADKMIGQQIEDYLILDRIGTGGMGAVFLTRRLHSDFTQKVALKLIKRGMDSEAILKRFATERRILSTLKHPNIAALVDGGISSEGLPFFVMEYVDGMPLNQYCRENDLSLNERLELFYKICSAVEHAHRNLVVHRDLKPSNILVTADGTPKLLDFGIAKLLTDDGSATAETLTQGKIFTPEYASPEQILGKPVSTSTDVYSLGVILYELLVDHRPFDVRGKSFDEIVEGICRTESPKPSDTADQPHITVDDAPAARRIPRTHLRGDIDNIVLKALRKDPTERYGSVQEFSADIRRYLSGMTVMARPQTLGYQFGKYVRRHKAAVSAAALVVISLVAGASIATWQAVVAQRERAKAERRFSDVRKLANSFLFEFHDAIQDLKGATPARKLVIERALPYLDDLAREAADDDSLQNELAKSYRQLGEIQGHPSFPNIGDVSGGIDSFRKAIVIGNELVSRNPNNREYRFNLAWFHSMIGDMFERAAYDTPKAVENYQIAVGLFRELNTENAADQNVMQGLLTGYERVGNIKAKSGELNAAINDYRESLAMAETLLALDPAKSERQRDVYLSYYEIGRAFQADGKYREALEQYSKGRAMLLKSLTSNPESADIQRLLGINDDLSANSHLELGEIDIANTLANNALSIREKLFAADPTNIQVYGDLTVSLDTAGDLRVKAGDVAGALKLLNRSLEMREAALKQDPTMTLAKRYVAISRNKIAAAYRVKGDLSAALAQLNTALTINRELCRDDPTNMELRRELASTLMATGETTALIASRERDPEKWHEAGRLLNESLKIYDDMRTNDRFFGADSGRVVSLKTFIEKHARELNG
ncbi:MAG: serine/threonine protein kinase [Pyrinomonadaceae bacterium]|nr:serine/threonine protein kinase [Pyrinomonadaceae bacterium]MBP6212398.1 serine/threonine protein kinase [Pyrinomonadaceae bacterium]